MDCQALANGIYLCEYTYGFWVQTGAIVLSSAAAIGLWWHTLAIAKKRATVDLVLQQRLDQKLLDAEDEFYPLLSQHINTQGHSFTRFAGNPRAPENKSILRILNNHEFAAAGIRVGTFDEKSYKRMLGSQVLMDWNALESYIKELRVQRNHPTLFQEFEWLATRWKVDPLTLINNKH